MKCFYHNDLDGRAAGSVIALITGNYDKEDYIEIDYVKKFPIELITPGENVYIVDYSFKEDDQELLREINKISGEFIWIDHHDSSIALTEKYPEFDEIFGIRSKKHSGAALTFMYFFNEPFERIPDYLQLVSDYDTWKFSDIRTNDFKNGMDIISHDALDSVWIDFYKEWEGQTNYVLDRLLVQGETVSKYIALNNAEHLKGFAYESVINYDGNDIKCLVINRRSNSKIFGEKYDEYPLVMVWVFNGEWYQYSIYSSDPTIDCSKIAESYGGGGHKGAAGFKSKELLFKKVI